MQQEAVIGGITEPSGSRKHFGALMLGVYDQGKLRYVGHTGTGFSDEMLKDILQRLTPYFDDSKIRPTRMRRPKIGSII